MNKAICSLNFMYCMERFATQIYRTQAAAFKSDSIAEQLLAASENERGHVFKLQAQIKALNGRVYPFGLLFQFMGIILGLITSLLGSRNLFRADTFIEARAVKDYNNLLKTVSFTPSTAKLIQELIADEEVHTTNWRKAAESLTTKE